MKSTLPVRERGFSLLELMIVVIVIGVAASMVTLSVGHKDPLAEAMKHAEGFKFWFNHQQQQSLLNHTEIGLYFTRDNVYALSWHYGDPDKGEPEYVWEQSDQFELAGNGSDVSAELILDLESQQWQELAKALPTDIQELQPQAFLLPSEEYFPSFSLTLTQNEYNDEQVTLTADGINPVELKREAR